MKKQRPTAVVVHTDALMIKISRLEKEKQELVKASETFKKLAEKETAKAKDLQEEMKKLQEFKEASYMVFVTKYEGLDPKERKTKAFKEFVPMAL